MQLKTKALVLSALKYQDKSLIVKCYTQELGIQSFFVRNAFSKKAKGLNSAYFQPLTLLEVTSDFKNKGGLAYFKEVRLAHAYRTLSVDFSKSSIALFIAEIIANVIREQETDPKLFLFLETALLWLDTHEQVANFHLLFLVDLSKFIGFYPDCTRMEKKYFNMLAGGFSDYFDEGCLEEDDTQLLKKLLGHSFSKDQQIFNGKERKRLLDIWMRYYELHSTEFRKPKSLEVLKEVFAN